MEPHIFADPDPGSQNLADPTDPDSKHCLQPFNYLIYSMKFNYLISKYYFVYRDPNAPPPREKTEEERLKEEEDKKDLKGKGKGKGIKT